jgi:hypothetical protein
MLIYVQRPKFHSDSSNIKEENREQEYQSGTIYRIF